MISRLQRSRQLREAMLRLFAESVVAIIEAENMIVIKDMEEHDGMLRNGIIYEPEGKKNYYGRITYNAADNTITLRGSLDKRGWIGRSQTWIR